MNQTKQTNAPHPKKVVFKKDNDPFEAKKNHSDYQLYQLANKESSLELSASKEKLNKIEKKLRHLKKFAWFRRNKIASLNQEKQNYQKKINALQTILHSQYKALEKKSITQLRSTLQPQQQSNSLKRTNKEYAR